VHICSKKHNLSNFWKNGKKICVIFVQTLTKIGGFFVPSCVFSLDKRALFWYYYTVSIVAQYSQKSGACATYN